MTVSTTTVVRRGLEVRGVVQGVGFRPFVARLAAERDLVGEVGNDEVSVFIEVEGPASAVDDFTTALTADAPSLAVVIDVAVTDLPVRGSDRFRIVPSRTRPGARTLVPPDVATCDDCLSELFDPADRRYRHPFITCTSCGPRFTIITDLPYDRPATTMAGFPMCDACAREYDDPADRRHHAQPIACHDCGPRLWWEDDGTPVLDPDTAVAAAQDALAAGAIVAVKGIGGFHLACDATDPDAVRRLRERKHRPDKPLAVMARDLGVVRRIAALSPTAEAALLQPARPIVLLPLLPDAALAQGIAPGLDEVGVMLPYSPLHHLLLTPVPGRDTAPDLLVMTSGNLSEEPLCFTNEDARERLGEIADAFLLHDRPIAVPCEDSVVALADGTAEAPVRRSRGYAPLPFVLATEGPTTLAVGAEVKNTFCVARDELAFCSAHVGDMGSLESQLAFGRAVDQLLRLRRATPELVVADQHPGYATRQWAENYVADHPGTSLVTVQHHHAHIASLLAEHGLVGEPALGLAFDGTGYGCDRQVWGGELLHVGADVADALRMGHLLPLALAGGDAAVRNPFRVALGLMRRAGVDDEAWTPDGVPADEVALVRSQLGSGLGCVESTSVGRLFDGVAALVGLRQRVTYEAQAAVELEALARSAHGHVDLPLPVVDGESVRLDWRPLVREIVAARADGAAPAALALGFHRALAAATTEAAFECARRAGVRRVGLTGGVFANRLLATDVAGRLRGRGIEVLVHVRVPCNDGGLSLGQAVVGRALAARGAVPPNDRRASGAGAPAPGREEVE